MEGLVSISMTEFDATMVEDLKKNAERLENLKKNTKLFTQDIDMLGTLLGMNGKITLMDALFNMAKRLIKLETLMEAMINGHPDHPNVQELADHFHQLARASSQS